MMSQGLLVTLLGVGAGAAVALALTRLLAGFLYGVRPADLATFLGASLALGAVSLLAVWIPAHRATRVDPLVALRHE